MSFTPHLTPPVCLLYRNFIMYKQDFIRSLAKKHRRPLSYYRTALNDILEGLTEQLKAGKEVQLLGFGTFMTRKHKGGKARNFKTGQLTEYKEYRQAAFKAGAVLKQAVRHKKGLFGI